MNIESPAALTRSLIGEVIVRGLEAGTPTCLLSDSAGAAAGASSTDDPTGTGDPSGAGEAAGTGGGPNAMFAATNTSGLFSPGHTHGAHEICWSIEGRCRVEVAGQRVVMWPGLVCLVRPGERHQIWPMPGPEPFRTLWWYVTERGVNLTIAGAMDHPYLTRIGFIALEPSPAPLVARVVRELEAERPHYQRIVRALLLELAASVLRALDEADQATQQQFPGQRWSSHHVNRVAQFVEAHHGPEVTLRHVAAAMGLSPHYLTALFRRYTGRTLMAYVNDVRHREALALLRGTDLDIKEVAHLVGYRDPYYFSRVFKAREGCAPHHYRDRLRTGSA